MKLVFYTLAVSMAPVVELRGAIPMAVAAGMDIWKAYIIAVIGNMIPVPFIIIFIRSIFKWMRTKSPRLNRLVSRMEAKADSKAATVPFRNMKNLDCSFWLQSRCRGPEHGQVLWSQP